MEGGCYIDGKNIYTSYGAVFVRGGIDEFLTFPSLADPPANDWPEEDGIEVDLENPVLNPREITLSFYAEDACSLIDQISKPGYHVFRVPRLGREWNLRLSSHSDNKVWFDSTRFALKLVEDAPVRLEEYNPAGDCGVILPEGEYEIDDVPLRDYGVTVIDGRKELLKSPTVKQNMLRKIQVIDGQIYDADQLVFNSKECTFKCLMQAKDMSRFWRCYDAFFNDLIQPGLRTLYVEYTAEEYPVYYKKMSGCKFLQLDKYGVVLEFDLTFVFTVFRIGETEYILATEDGEWIVLEEDGETCIDMKTYAD